MNGSSLSAAVRSTAACVRCWSRISVRPVLHWPVRFALTALLSGVSFGQEPAQPNFYAVVIGVSEFENLPKEEWLEYANRDAKTFYDFITSPRGRAFPPENVFLLTDKEALSQAMRTKLGSTLAKKIKPEDTVYIFIATHGTVEREAAKEGYLMAYDSDREDLYTSAMPMRELGNIMQNRLKNARRIFLFADVCRAGKLGQVQGAVNRYIEDASSKTETMGLLASRPNEFSRESDQWGGGHGVFTYYLLKGLMGEADVDKDNTVTASELISYLQTNVEDATERQQHIRDFGDFEPETPMSFVDKPGPENSHLAASFRRSPTLVAALQGGVPRESDVVRDALDRAIAEGRLLSPAGNSAWDIYQRYLQYPLAEEERSEAEDQMVIVLASAGDKVLWAYRRGDQVIPLNAAKYAEGAELFGRASEISRDDLALQSKAKFMAGRAMVENRQFDQGIALLREAVSLDPAAAYAYNGLGIAYMEQQRWNEAIENFRAASARAQMWVYPHYNLATLYAKNLRRFREAEEEFRAGIAIENELGLKYAYLHYNLGALYLEQRRFPQAEEQFRRAIELKPDDGRNYTGLGMVFEMRKNLRDAEANYLKAGALDPKLVQPRLQLAELYRQQRQPELQQRVLEEAMAADPADPTVLAMLGQLLLANKLWDRAEQHFTQMLMSNVDPVGALSGLGDVHAGQENWPQAAEDYRQAIARTTDRNKIRELERKLQSAERRR
ncbi:MAG: tetratricopeptide repeat protein [Acidobacteria bacterium]|nr:tetratricopeptide repeat protein [Acidobacteriota bacterium]